MIPTHFERTIKLSTLSEDLPDLEFAYTADLEHDFTMQKLDLGESFEVYDVTSKQLLSLLFIEFLGRNGINLNHNKLKTLVHLFHEQETEYFESDEFSCIFIEQQMAQQDSYEADYRRDT